MSELFTNVVANLPQYLEVLVQVVGTFALVATLTPNTSDNAIADFLAKVVNFLAGNFGKSTNG